MRFKGLDLNLLAAFAVLVEERSVSRAAERLNLSQPAVSAALARLRIYFGDALLVAEGKRMFPTALAEALAPQVAAVLDGVGAIVDTAGTFDPATSARTFRIAASDYIALVVFPRLVQRLEQVAPGVRIVLELPDERTRARLDEGRIDLFVTPQEFASSRHPVALLFTERHVVVGCADNPALGEGRISEADFLALDHVAVLLGTNVPAAFADRQLEQIGKVRQIGVTVPSFAAVPWMVVGTRRIALMHERLACLMQTRLPIVLAPVPFAFPEMSEVIQHHRARDADPGLRWLRDQLRVEAAAD